MAAGCGRHGIPPPACKNPTSYRHLPWQLMRMFDQRTSFEVPKPSFQQIWYSFSLNSSRAWPLTLTLARIIAGIRNRLPNFDASGTFRSRLMGQHLSDAPCDIATLTFDLAVDGPSRRYGSSSSICTASLNFVGIPIRKILRIYCVSISRPWRWPWNWWALVPVGWTTFLPILVLLRFRSRLIGQHLSDAPCDIATLTFVWPWRSWRLLVIQVFVLRLYTKFEVCSYVSVRKMMMHFRSQHYNIVESYEYKCKKNCSLYTC